MSVIYVREQGAVIGREGERLVVSKGNEVLEEFPLANVEQLALMGNVQLTTQAMATLLEREVDVVLLSSYGKFRGRLTGTGSRQAQLRQQQMAALQDGHLALTLARALVDGKVNNQRVVLQRQSQRLQELAAGKRGTARVSQFQQALKGMLTMQREAAQARSLDSLRGYEGKAAAYYFQAIGTLLEPEWQFQGRAYYPPPDPFNALLSFAYSLLQKDVFAAVNQVGLDAYLGCFHEIAYGRPSLVLDLMEEWRPYLADPLALELVNRGALRPETFRKTGNPKRPIELGEAGVGLVLEAYGRRLEGKLFHPGAGPGGETSLRQAILLQARQLAQVFRGQRQAYEAIKAK